MIFLIGVWNLARLSTFSMGNLTRTRSIRLGPHAHTKMSLLRSADVARTAIPAADLRRHLRIRVPDLRPHSPNKIPLDPAQHAGQIPSQDLPHNYPDKRP
jgi:hypothetical protein